MSYQVTIRACGGAVGSTHTVDDARELSAFLAGVDAAVTLIAAEVVVERKGQTIERRIVGSDQAARDASVWLKSA